jgi:hypothetical protein
MKVLRGAPLKKIKIKISFRGGSNLFHFCRLVGSAKIHETGPAPLRVKGPTVLWGGGSGGGGG